MPAPEFPSPRFTAGLALAAIGVGIIGLWGLYVATTTRPALHMKLIADVSEVEARIEARRPSGGGAIGPLRRELLSPGALLEGLEWRGVHVVGEADNAAGTLRIDRVKEPFVPTLLVEGTADVQFVRRKEDDLVLFVRASREGRLRMELSPTIDGCITTSGFALPAPWQGVGASSDCPGRPAPGARVVILESYGDARLDLHLDNQADPARLFVMPLAASAVRFEEPDPHDGSTRRYVQGGAIELGVGTTFVTTLPADVSVSADPLTRFMITRLAFALPRGAMAIEVTGLASSVRLGPDADSREELIPTWVEQRSRDESFRWWLGGLVGLLGAVGYTVSQVVGWYHQARQIEASQHPGAQPDTSAPSKSAPACTVSSPVPVQTDPVGAPTGAATGPEPVTEPCEGTPPITPPSGET